MMSGLWLLGQVTVGTPEILVVRDLVLVGAGLGVTMPLYLNATQGAVDRRYLGVVSSQVQFWRNIGGTIGVSVLGAVLAHQLPAKISSSIAALDLPSQAVAAIPAGGSPQAIFDSARIAATRASLPPQVQELFDQVLTAIRSALASTIHDVFVYATVVVAIAVVASLFLEEVPIRGHAPAEAREGAPAFGG